MAPLIKQNVFLSFNKGVDTSTDSKLVIPAKFNKMDNLELDKVTTFRQRPGYTKATTTGLTTSILNVRQLHAMGADIILESDNGLHSFAQDSVISRNSLTTYNNGVTVGSVDSPFERAQVDFSDIGGNPSVQLEVDAACAIASGLECWVWTESVGAALRTYYKIVDSTNREELQSGPLWSPTTSSGVADLLFAPRVVVRTSAGASSFYIYHIHYTDATTTYTLQHQVITVAANAKTPSALSASTAIVTTGSGVFDAWFDTTGADKVVLAYHSAASANIAIKMLAGSDGKTATATATDATGVIPIAISVATVRRSGTTYALATWTTAAGNLYGFSVTAAAGSPNTVLYSPFTSPYTGRVAVVPSPFSSDSFIIFADWKGYTANAVYPTDVFHTSVAYNAAASGFDGFVARGAALAARPIAYYGTVGGSVDLCVPVAIVSNLQPTILMMKFGGSLWDTASRTNNVCLTLARLFPGECDYLSRGLVSVIGQGLRMPTCLAVS